MSIPSHAIPWWAPPTAVVGLGTGAVLVPADWAFVDIDTTTMNTLWEVEATLYGLTAAVGVFAVQSFATVSGSLRAGALVDYARASGLLLMLEFQTALLVLTALVAFDIPGFEADGPPGLLAAAMSLAFIVPLPVLLRDMLDELDHDAVEAFERRRLRRDMRLATRKRASGLGRALRHVDDAIEQLRSGGTRGDHNQIDVAGARLATLMSAIPAGSALPEALGAKITSIEQVAEDATKWHDEASASGVAVLLRASVERADKDLAKRVLETSLRNGTTTALFNRSWAEVSALGERPGAVGEAAVFTLRALAVGGARLVEPEWVVARLDELRDRFETADHDALLVAIYAALYGRRDLAAAALASVAARVLDASAAFRGRARLAAPSSRAWLDLPPDQLNAATVDLALARVPIGQPVEIDLNEWLHENRGVVEDLLEQPRPHLLDGGTEEWQRTALLAAVRSAVPSDDREGTP